MSATEQVQIMEHGLFDTQSRTMIIAYDLFNNYGGCSFYWRDGMMAMITNGYMVGGASKSITVASDQIDMRLFSYMWDYFTDKFSALSDDDELCLGRWKDPSNGAMVMELSTWHGDEAEAVALSISREQKAYYDVERNKTVYVI